MVTEGNPEAESHAEVDWKVLKQLLTHARVEPAPFGAEAFAEGLALRAAAVEKLAYRPMLIRSNAEAYGMAIVRLASYCASFVLQATHEGLDGEAPKSPEPPRIVW